MACYEIKSCQDPGIIETINTSAVLAVGDFIKPTPAITGPTYLDNCWEVIGVSPPPCSPTAISITSVILYNNCSLCLAVPSVCYSLTSCDGLMTSFYTNSNLAAFVGNYVTNTIYVGQCFYVAVSQTCPATIVFNSPQLCNCPCYTLTDCAGIIPPFNTNVNLASEVGNLVHLNEYGGCLGSCFQVSVNTGTCLLPQNVTVSTDCQPCPPCSCYRLIDCITREPYLTLSSPTLNNINLAPLVGQVIGQVCLGPNNTQCTNGCWEVQAVPCNGNQSSVYVYNISPTCEACNAVCYKLTNCETFQEVLVEYTVPNITLPNLSTLVGQTLSNPCFNSPTGCLSGCWTVSINNNPDCNGAINWSNALSYTALPTCDDCLPKCYLLTECAPSIEPPIIVSNDLSFYVGNTVKICDSNDVCKCYNVQLAQSCNGSIVIDNANARFINCEECNSCFCPPGYIKVDDRCQKISSVPAIQNQKTYNVVAGDVSNTYGSLGTRFYSGVSLLPYPLIAVNSPDRFVDASSTNVPFTTSIVGVWGGPVGSRLNTVGVWTSSAPLPLNEWIGFSKCIINTESTTYCIGIGGDDHVRIKLDGVVVAEATIGSFDYNFWHVFELNIQAGTHIITVEGRNIGGISSFGAEIYKTNIAALSSITTTLALQTVTVFSTFSKRNNNSLFDTGENSGYSCPDGYSYNNCETPSCSLIETIPYTDCANTYRVIDCGVQDDIITNTDLSAFLTGTYKACFNTPDVWPEGCYCIKVEEIPYAEGINFSAVISQTEFDCCEDCLQVCYELTDCNKILQPVIVCNDLSAYLGGVIKIEGCGDICWQVNSSQTCIGSTKFEGKITFFTDCNECLPPMPPTPPPYDLHLRKIKPGYNSPNSCYSTNYIENINCKFAEQVYNQMLVKRFGITVCCEEDLDTWDIKKQLMDLDILKDPNLCRSTLCDCKPPCLVNVVFELLPYCADPNIISVTSAIVCQDPVIIGVEIEVFITPASCNCYTITPFEQPIQIQYLDCCCVVQRILIDNLQPVNVCASTIPAVYPDPASANVVLNGDCDAIGPCNPPICYCWKVTNNNNVGSPDGSALFDSCVNDGTYTGSFIPPGQSVSNCGYNPPSVSQGLIVENLGPCVNGSCNPPVCVCYRIDSNTDCEYTYVNCNDVNSFIIVPRNIPVYVCGKTVPVRSPGCPPGGTVTSTPYNCIDGVCQVP